MSQLIDDPTQTGPGFAGMGLPSQQLVYQRPNGSPAAWWRRVLAVLLALSLSFAGAPATAAQDDGYWLRKVTIGWTDRGVVILEFRDDNPEVTADRNVAVFPYLRSDRVPVWIVAASTGAQSPDARQFVRIGEKVGDEALHTRVIPWIDFQEEFGVNPRNKHAEFLVFAYLNDEQRLRVYGGESENKPCTTVRHQCRDRLRPVDAEAPSEKRTWFPNLHDMTYQYEYGNGDEQEDDRAASDRERDLRKWTRSGRRLPVPMERTILPAPAPAAPGGSPVTGPPASLFSHGSGIPAQGAAVTALAGAGDDLGGVDFTTLELRYLADPGDGQGIQYAFHADLSDDEDPDLDAGRTAALHASDAFFVWLSLPRSTFWVNLHPYEPDRIVHPALGTTDVGRILLEADLEMKRTEAKLIHPDTELGQEYWAAVEAAGPEPCMSARMWIVPGPATVYEEDGGLYILDAPLEVKMEAESIGAPTEREPTDDPCHRPAGAPEPPHEKFSQERVLPLIEEAVNKAPEYAELRQVYLSRVAAEWYREHSRHTDTSLAWLIDSGDVSAWPAMRDWSSQEVFDDYVESFNEGEFNVRREVQQGSDLYEVIYIFGGVDFGTVPITSLEDSQFQVNWVGLPDAVGRAIDQPAMTPDNGVWLGGTAHPTAPDGWEAAARGPTNNIGQLVTIVVVAVLILMVAGVGITMAIVLSRGRLSHRPTGMPHSPPRPPPYRHW